MRSPTPPPNPSSAPDAALLQLAWENVAATARPRPAWLLDSRPVRRPRLRWGRRRGGGR